jgi:hypothetical protein
MGPICQIMNINRGDRFDYLVSMDSNDFMMKAKAEELAAKDDFFKPFVDKTYRGNMSSTLIRTVKGKTIMVQHDATSPRGPHTMIHAITGTKALAQEYPLPGRISKDLNGWVAKDEHDAIVKEYTPTIVTHARADEKERHGGGDILECWRLIDCLQRLPLDQTFMTLPRGVPSPLSEKFARTARIPSTSPISRQELGKRTSPI